jgi:hypothetical protein
LFLQKINISKNKPDRLSQNFSEQVTKLMSTDEITRLDGTRKKRAVTEK